MLDAIKHITDDNFFFQKDSTQVHCVTQSNWVKMRFSRFPVLPGIAEAQVTWGAAKCLLIVYFISNITAKNYQNLFMCIKVIASQRWDFFETRCIKYSNDNNNKWSKSFDIRPHRRRTWTVQSYSSAGANVHPIYRKPKMVAMATSLRTSKMAMSSSDSLTPKTHPENQTTCR